MGTHDVYDCKYTIHSYCRIIIQIFYAAALVHFTVHLGIGKIDCTLLWYRRQNRYLRDVLDSCSERKNVPTTDPVMLKELWLTLGEGLNVSAFFKN